MKNGTIIFLLLLAAQCSAQSKFQGTWQGTLQAGGGLKVLFHIKDSAGIISASMDSPDQGANGIPFSSATIKGDSIVLEVQMLHANFKGVLQHDSLLNGVWSQGPASLPLQMHRAVNNEKAAIINRPQTPKPPFAYNSDSVEYDNAAKSVHFGATFTYPKNGSHFPAAILITGSGQEDRDETIFNHRPFAVIADYLTKQGYAVLRADDRGIGKTTGDVNSATSKDFAQDAQAGIAYLQSRKEVDKNKIGLIGHSEGGLIASLVAANNKNIAFVIMLAGPGENGADLLAAQNEAILGKSGIAAKAAESYASFYKTVLNDVLENKDSASAFAASWKSFKEWKNGLDSSTMKALNVQSDENSQQLLSSLIHTASSPWFTYFIASNPADFIKQFYCKTLALNGEKDIQVIAKSNLQGIETALKQSHSPAYETHQLAGLNHLFQHCQTCTFAEYGQLEETFAPEALQLMGAWLHKNVE